MSEKQFQGSAKIYQFPVREHVAAASYRAETKPALHAMTPRAAKVVCGGAWYHEEAINDAEQSRRN